VSSQSREVVAVFDGPDALEEAVFDLETHGFDRAAFSVLASEEAVERAFGRRYTRIEEMEDAPAAPRETFFSKASRLEAEFGLAPALAFLGAVAVGLGATAVSLPILVAAGSGAAIGALLGRLIHQHNAERVREQLERGGLLLWVNVRNPDEEEKAARLLNSRGARDVHAHDVGGESGAAPTGGGQAGAS
jgi:hypothetical protein